MTQRLPFMYFKTSPEIIRLDVMMCFRFLLSFCNVRDLLRKRGIEIGNETAQFRWSCFGSIFAAKIPQKCQSENRAV